MNIRSIIITLCFIVGINPAFSQEYVLNKGSEPITWKGYGEAGGFTQQGTIKVVS